MDLKSTEIIIINNININNNNNDTIPQLPAGRSRHASVGIGNFVFVIGGKAESYKNTVLRRVLRININNIHNPTTKWESVAPMQQGRFSFAAVAIGDVIYAVGGRHDYTKNKFHTIEMLDTATTMPEWVTLAARMSTARAWHGAVAIGNVMYIIGGVDDNRNELTSVEMFDTASQTITEGPALPIAIARMSAVAIGTLVMVVGGYTTGGQEIGHFYVLDTSASNPKWQKIGVELQTPRCDHTAVVVGDKVCVCGGWDDGGNVFDSIETISIVDLVPRDLHEQAGLLPVTKPPPASPAPASSTTVEANPRNVEITISLFIKELALSESYEKKIDIDVYSSRKQEISNLSGSYTKGIERSGKVGVGGLELFGVGVEVSAAMKRQVQQNLTSMSNVANSENAEKYSSSENMVKFQQGTTQVYVVKTTKVYIDGYFAATHKEEEIMGTRLTEHNDGGNGWKKKWYEEAWENYMEMKDRPDHDKVTLKFEA